MDSSRVDLPFPTTRVLVVSDFNCPYCFTLNEWLEDIGAGARVRWVGIEHRPDLPHQGPNKEPDVDTLAREVADVQDRAPEVQVVRPDSWQNSRSALLVQNALEDDDACPVTASTDAFELAETGGTSIRRADRAEQPSRNLIGFVSS